MEPAQINNPTPEDTTITKLVNGLQDAFEQAKNLYPGYCISVSWNTSSHPDDIKSIHRYNPQNDLLQEFATLSNHTLQTEIYDSWEEV